MDEKDCTCCLNRKELGLKSVVFLDLDLDLNLDLNLEVDVEADGYKRMDGMMSGEMNPSYGLQCWARGYGSWHWPKYQSSPVDMIPIRASRREMRGVS